MSESELIEALRGGAKPEYIFDQIVKMYSQRLYWHIRRMSVSHEDANDLLQNAFIKVWSNLSSFRGDSNVYTWLYRITTNEVLTFFKRDKSGNTDSLEENENTARNIAADEYFQGDKLQLYLQEAIAKLPEKQRIVFSMRYFEETKYERMSEILGTSVGALKASYHLAAEKVEAYLREHMEI